MASSPHRAVANSISRRYFSAVAGPRGSFANKIAAFPETRSRGEERYIPLLSWLLEVMNDPLCDRRESRRGVAWPGSRRRRSASDMYVHERVRMYNERVVYFTRQLLCISRLDEKFISRSTPRWKKRRDCRTPRFLRLSADSPSRRDPRQFVN